MVKNCWPGMAFPGDPLGVLPPRLPALLQQHLLQEVCPATSCNPASAPSPELPAP